MEPGSSLLCLIGTTTYPSAGSHQSTPGPLSYFLKINFNIIIPCTPTSSKQALYSDFPFLNPVFASPVPLHAACLFHLIPLDFSPNDIQAVHIMKVLTVQFPPLPCYLDPLRT